MGPDTRRTARMLAVVLAALVVIAGCSTGRGVDPPSQGKAWTVDTSGFWLPDDPSGCLEETTTCRLSAWPVREYYRGGLIYNVFQHGDTIELLCRAPTPESIRNSLLAESVYWFYADIAGRRLWVPDVWATGNAVEDIAADVPDCPSSTPGINGRPA